MPPKNEVEFFYQPHLKLHLCLLCYNRVARISSQHARNEPACAGETMGRKQHVQWRDALKVWAHQDFQQYLTQVEEQLK